MARSRQERRTGSGVFELFSTQAAWRRIVSPRLLAGRGGEEKVCCSERSWGTRAQVVAMAMAG